MNIIRYLICLLLFITPVSFADMNMADKLKDSDQLLLVTTPNWNTMQGLLQRYQRDDSAKDKWIKIGNDIPVVIGKNGMALGVDISEKGLIDTFKKEGDLRTPAGIFPVGTAFGFASKPDLPIGLNYLPLTESTFCVDDQTSTYYNQIIDTTQVKQDWQTGTGEYMGKQPLYHWGAVIQYNMPSPVRGSGSCIFLHIWRSPDSGTAGCVAMAEDNLKQLLTWLDATKKPMIILFPESEMEKYHLGFERT